jgi:hypothetical protein
MRDLPCCPQCGSPVAVSGHGRASARDEALGSLYREVRRIREIAEARQDGPPAAGPRPRAWDEREARLRIEELTHEVNELRATVARLRGSAPAGLDGRAGRRAPAA